MRTGLLGSLTIGLLITALTASNTEECLPSLKPRKAYVNILYNENCTTVDSIREYKKQSLTCAAYDAKIYILAHNGPGNIFVFKNGFQQRAGPLYTNTSPKYASNTIGQICYKDNFFVFTITSNNETYKLIAVNCLTNKFKVINKNSDKEFCLSAESNLVRYHSDKLDKSFALLSNF